MNQSNQGSKFNINIGNISGGEVQVGDRTYYQGMNSAEIQELVRSLTTNLQPPVAPLTTATRKILFLAASPTDQTKLQLAEEVRDIAAVLRQANHADQFSLERREAVSAAELQTELLHEKPEIVHFSGHGSGEDGLIFEDKTGRSQFVSTDALTTLFALMRNDVKCVILNACYSQVQAEAITQHIDYVIGMSKAIGDKSAIIFASAFYLALGSGRSIEDAYQFGCNAIALQGISEHLTPQLLIKSA